MLDSKNIADLRLALIRANVATHGRGEEELIAQVRPVIGELLALADAALKIRRACKRPVKEGDAQNSSSVIVSATVLAMRDLDDLEHAHRRAGGSRG